MGGIIKAPMVAVHLAGKHRAGVVRVAAHRDHGFDFPVEELLQVLGAVAGNINPNLVHHAYCQRMNIPRRL